MSFLVLGVGDVGGEPVQALVEPLAGGGAGGLDEPVALADGVQPELVGDLRRGHRVGQVLLVREHQQHGVAQLVLFVCLLGGCKVYGGGQRVK